MYHSCSSWPFVPCPAPALKKLLASFFSSSLQPAHCLCSSQRLLCPLSKHRLLHVTSHEKKSGGAKTPMWAAQIKYWHAGIQFLMPSLDVSTLRKPWWWMIIIYSAKKKKPLCGFISSVHSHYSLSFEFWQRRAVGSMLECEHRRCHQSRNSAALHVGRHKSYIILKWPPACVGGHALYIFHVLQSKVT